MQLTVYYINMKKNVRLSQVSKTKIAYSYYRNYSSAVEIFRLEKLFINV